MSELKATTIYDAYWKANSVGEGTGVLVYIKSEADKEIEFWKKESHDHYERWFNLNKQYEGWFGKVMRCERAERELRHQKYKRCLAMAQEWRNYAAFCGMQSHCHNHRGFGKTAEKWTWKECHAWRCVKRYKELAEKFKHNNEVNNGN